jgi:SAM-dependent methyltransferase
MTRPPRHPPPLQDVGAHESGPPGELHRDQEPRARRRWVELDRVQLELAGRVAARHPGARMLELGCGTGRLLGRVAMRLRFGADLSPASLALARRRLAGETSPVSLLRADVHRLPFADGSFELLLAGDGVFGQLDYARAFAECHRLLTPDGRLALHFYAGQPFSLRPSTGPGHDTNVINVVALEELEHPARRAGLVRERVWLWRSVRFPPYLVRLPEAVAWRFWTHGTFVFRKPGRAA